MKLSSPIALPDGSSFDAGEWLVQDDNAFQLAIMAERGTCELRAWECTRASKGHAQYLESVLSSPKSILLIRSGAIGDLLLLSPAILALQIKYPAANISLACHKRHFPVLTALEVQLTEYPLPVASLSNYDLIIPLENVVELSTEKGVHATDAFADALGVTVTDYKPVYRVTDAETIGLANPSKPRVALQLHASAVIRNYPMQLWFQVIATLVARGWEIMLLGNQDGMKGAPAAVKDCSKLSFREAAAALATCNVFCGVDSSFFNLCPALGVPAIGLFGPVDWHTRIKSGSGQIALHGEAECAPCGWTNTRAGRRFPPNGPCAKTGYCVPMSEIKPERIVSVIEREAKK